MDPGTLQSLGGERKTPYTVWDTIAQSLAGAGAALRGNAELYQKQAEQSYQDALARRQDALQQYNDQVKQVQDDATTEIQTTRDAARGGEITDAEAEQRIQAIQKVRDQRIQKLERPTLPTRESVAGTMQPDTLLGRLLHRSTGPQPAVANPLAGLPRNLATRRKFSPI